MRGWGAIVALFGLAVASMPNAAARVGPSPAAHRSFPWLVPTLAPPGWGTLTTAARTATLAYPPSFQPIGGDPGTVSAAVEDPPGTFLAYLNATPRQGREPFHGFAAFRVRLLGEDHDESVTLEASGEQLPFRGGEGSCVMDRYVTRVDHHHYREIACLVVGPYTPGTVVVATAATAAWGRYRPPLQTAIAAFAVT